MRARLSHSELQLLLFLVTQALFEALSTDQEHAVLRQIIEICQRVLPPDPSPPAPAGTVTDPMSDLERAEAARQHAGDTP